MKYTPNFVYNRFILHKIATPKLSNILLTEIYAKKKETFGISETQTSANAIYRYLCV